MEQGPQKEEVGVPSYRIFWHQRIKEDFSKIPIVLTETMIKAAEFRLSRAPHLIGQPLKGTANKLWRIRFDKYRIVYTLKANEVWVLSVQKREVIYQNRHVQALLRLALAIHQEIDK